MKREIRLTTLWMLTIIGMILHFNYHVGELFYGIDIVKPEANGLVPISTFIIRTLFYHFPIVWIVILMFNTKRWVNLILFCISLLYLLAHLMHLTKELMSVNKDPSQISLLGLVFGLSVLLSIEHFKFWKDKP